MATKTKSSSNGVNRIASVKAELSSKTVEIKPLRNQTLTFMLKGTSPLVTHRFDDKSRQQMLDKQMGKKETKRDWRCPEYEFLHAFYWVDSEPPAAKSVTDGVPEYDKKVVAKAIKDASFGIPLTAFKNAIISAARNTDLTMAGLKQQLFVSSPDHHEFAIIKGTPRMHNAIGRIGRNIPIEIFRPMWEEWQATISVTFDSNMLSAEAVANLVNIAGFYVGVCEGRPEKSALGWGRWEIQ